MRIDDPAFKVRKHGYFFYPDFINIKALPRCHGVVEISKVFYLKFFEAILCVMLQCAGASYYRKWIPAVDIHFVI
jgi:hypothetical protein